MYSMIFKSDLINAMQFQKQQIIYLFFLILYFSLVYFGIAV